MKKKVIASAIVTTLMLLTTATSAQAANPKLCVYDLLGATGDMFNLAKDYVLAARKDGVTFDIKAYTDERIASEEFLAGQCDGLMATGLRIRQFNPVAGSIDSLGVSTIVRDNKIDMPASYDVVRKTVQIFSSPATSALMITGKYEIGGMLPFGAAYPVVNDRNINTVEKLAGKKIAAFDYDKSQAVMIQKIGAQPVSADITNFAGKFNNGSVDMIAAPAAAYRPLELYRGIGTKGAINRFPIVILTYQIILNKDKFPAGYGLKSRQYWASQFDRAMALITKSESAIPAATWGDLTPENLVKYTVMLRESRITMAGTGLYNKQGLKIIKRVRCSINPGDAECSTSSEN